MSGVASPAPSRSPTVAAGAIDGAQLAMRMVEAAERAADAAHAASALAAAAMAATGSSSPPAAKPTEWYKMLPKPPTFSPQSCEVELSMFREWGWQLEQYLLAVDVQFGPELESVRGNLDTKYDLVLEMSAEKAQRSTFLYGLLASLLKGRPLMMLKSVEQGNGF